jgi:superfamily II DNA or RNA helicase
VLAYFSAAKVLGVTATPVRLSGEGLIECFETMILGPTVLDLVRLGALCPVRVFAPPTIQTDGLHTRMGDFVKSELTAVTDTATVTGDAVAHYQRHADGKAAVAFCVSVAHAEHVATQFKAAGIRAYSVDGTLDRLVRRQIIAAFMRREIQVLTSCDLVSEGFDVPHCEVGISLRPTQSEGLWLQQCGRILRPAPGKTEALILDHAGNTMRHGFPDEVREWSLEGRPDGKKAADGNRGVRVCPKCFGAMRGGTPVCTYCQHVFVAQPREVKQAEGELVELDRVQVQEQRRREQGQARTRDDLIQLARQRGYARPDTWADAIIRHRERKMAGAA